MVVDARFLRQLVDTAAIPFYGIAEPVAGVLNQQSFVWIFSHRAPRNQC